MINGVGRDGGLARAAFDAAFKALEQKAEGVDSKFAQAFDSTGALQRGDAVGNSVENTLFKGLEQTNDSVKQVENLPLEMITGKIGDFHEVAGRLKQAELMFKFSLEVRNKLIDAYRETMRMNV